MLALKGRATGRSTGNTSQKAESLQKANLDDVPKGKRVDLLG